MLNLFDSLLMGYPIGTLLFWKVNNTNWGITNRYLFVGAIKEKGGNVTQLAPPLTQGELTFVLDGQQRLTSLYVGLLGTIQVKNQQNNLYVNLLFTHTSAGDDELTKDYLSFRNASGYSDTKFWFRVGNILQINNEGSLGELTNSMIDQVAAWIAPNEDQKNLIAKNLNILYQTVCVEENLSYYTEDNPDEERILEIFIRINSGGIQLSRSELLLSTLSLHWIGIDNKNPKTIVQELVDRLVNILSVQKTRIGTDFVMKACLVMTGMPVAYNISSFTQENCQTIGRNWKAIESALLKTAKLLKAMGITNKAISSANALLPIAYFFYKNPKVEVGQESNGLPDVFSDIRRWLVMALINGVLGGSSDSMLTGLRHVLSGVNDVSFPIASLDRFVSSRNVLTTFDPKGIDNIMSLKYGDNGCILALSLLYKEQWLGISNLSVDHLVAQHNISVHFGRDYAKKEGQSIANLTLVNANDNGSKGNISLKNWLCDKDANYLEKHLIPTNKELWEIDKYSEFIAERAKLMRKKLLSVLVNPQKTS